MNHFETHQSFYNQIIKLTPEEAADPIDIFDLFFVNNTLAQVRHHLHCLQQVALTTDNEYFKNPKDRDSIAWFCQDLEELLEAVWALNQKESPWRTQGAVNNDL